MTCTKLTLKQNVKMSLQCNISENSERPCVPEDFLNNTQYFDHNVFETSVGGENTVCLPSCVITEYQVSVSPILASVQKAGLFYKEMYLFLIVFKCKLVKIFETIFGKIDLQMQITEANIELKAFSKDWTNLSSKHNLRDPK